MRALFCATAIALMLTGCSWVPRLGVYKLDINQGNYITSDQVDRLKVGQTRQQVRAVLGTPMLADAFHADRWDYPYEFNRLGRTLEHRQFTVYFVDDKLARSVRNLPGVSIVQSTRLTARDVIGAERVIATQGALEKLQEALA